MDFKSLMSAQISKAKPPSGASPGSAGSKYVRRADVEAARQAAYEAEQARLAAEREERAAKKRKLEEGEAQRIAAREEKKRKWAEESRVRREAREREEERLRRKRLGLPELPEPADENDEAGKPGERAEEEHAHDHDHDDIPDDELRSQLRQLDEPVTLFDESHAARLQRYRALRRRRALASQLSNGPIPTSLELLPEKDILLPEKVPPDGTPEHKFVYRQLASYFTLLLSEWSIALSQRDAAVKESSTGKAAYNSYTVVVRDLTPLFRRFEKADLEPGLLEPICEVVRHAQHRRYVAANDAYLRLSIGKAAWPIGVTMVGIHERSAREKLHESDKQAHILSDEVTRKFLQSIKRCLSFAQTRWPPEDLAQLMG